MCQSKLHYSLVILSPSLLSAAPSTPSHIPKPAGRRPISPSPSSATTTTPGGGGARPSGIPTPSSSSSSRAKMTKTSPRQKKPSLPSHQFYFHLSNFCDWCLIGLLITKSQINKVCPTGTYTLTACHQRQSETGPTYLRPILYR